MRVFSRIWAASSIHPMNTVPIALRTSC
jgi:hypothetical protein